MAGIDVVLDTIFNNPSLPVVPVYGFYDDFERPNGALGVTTREAKPWIEHTYPGANIAATIDSGKLKATGTTLWKVVAVDAKSPNGTFRAVVSSMDVNGGLRLAVRALNATNFLMIRFVSGGVIRLGKFIAGAETVVANSAALTGFSSGVFEVVMNGTQVSVLWNGAQVIAPQTIPELAGNMQHGFMMRSESPNARVDEVAFRAS